MYSTLQTPTQGEFESDLTTDLFPNLTRRKAHCG